MATENFVAPGHTVRADGESYATFTAEDIAKDKAMFSAQGHVEVDMATFESWVLAHLAKAGNPNPTYNDRLAFVEEMSGNGVIADPDYGDGIVYFLPLDSAHDL
jgi:hypothetical protein